jgi:hypothetical protein
MDVSEFQDYFAGLPFNDFNTSLWTLPPRLVDDTTSLRIALEKLGASALALFTIISCCQSPDRSMTKARPRIRHRE